MSTPSSSPPPPAGASQSTYERTALSDPALQHIHAQILREKGEPQENFSRYPLIIVFLFAGLAFWGGLYLLQFSGGFKEYVYNEHFNPYQTAAASTTAPVFDYMKAGARFYKTNCVACHQNSGLGVPGAFPTLVQSEWVQGPPERLIKILLHGMSGPITVNGSSYNGNMPAFGTYKDRDLAAVLTWVRGNADFGNAAGPVTDEQVAAIRKAFPRTTAWPGPEIQNYTAPNL